jgi:hypothetical protein
MVFLVTVHRSITCPLTRLNGAMGEMAGGNLNITIPGIERRDEIERDWRKMMRRHSHQRRAGGNQATRKKPNGRT